MKTIFTLLFTYLTVCYLNGQDISFRLGGGISPYHDSGQSDFTPSERPLKFIAMATYGKLGLHLGLHGSGVYTKENFTHRLNSWDSGIAFFPIPESLAGNFDFYIYSGITRWDGSLTTQGYPGINDYELKIENDSNWGVHAGIGLGYHISSFTIGTEVQLDKNSPAQYIAGGFVPQPISSDLFRVSVVATYRLKLTDRPSFTDIICPSF